ncbi:beta subunit of N-acylethanolamine-hydrolyzing acid amidase-domain-containing protein [Xylariaceae sp. FL1651]|nr:beta subunit of N-acylethanolamine-hydrolyzing acid amidase-domain-containing protein [Xylariaceae sp. FL1651]
MATPTTSQERIPCFTIDLAKPPRERYDEVVQVLGPRMRSLTGLFDDLLSMFITSAWLSSLVRRLSKVCLYRVYDEEENEEIKGISARSGVPLYLLVALNNLLDCLLGCTSGAVSVSPSKTSRKHGDRAGRDHTRLMHFRTLDWGMDELRDLLVVLEFVDSSSGNARQIIARSITYAGFVGSLTAISQGMSISLNHRPNHDCPSRQLRWHQLLVLLGKRRSIGSIVRSFMLRPVQHGGEAEQQAKVLTLIPSAPCYLVLCNGQEVALIVKDYVTGTVQTSREFIAQTNHDPKDQRESRVRNETSPSDRREVITSSFGIEGWLEESIDRLQCIQKKWDRLAQKSRRKPASTTASAKTGEVVESQREILSVTETTLRRWMSDYPTLNECSHFTALLDPASGEIRWLMRGLVEGSSEEHQVQN